MKIIKFTETRMIKAGYLESYDYDANDPDMNLGVVKINGRHPKQNYVINTGCKELFYILSGEGSITTHNETYVLTARDEVIIDQNEPYYIEGNFTFVTVCTPVWTVEQVKIVDKEGREL